MKYTDEQDAIIEASLSEERLVVNALAGTGKTSTAIACAKAQKPCKIAYLCFNRANAEEMRQKFARAGIESSMDSTTLHALAFRHVGSFMLKEGRSLGTIKPYDIEGICSLKNTESELITDRAVQARGRKLVLDGASLWCHSKAKSMGEFWKAGLPKAIMRQIREYGISYRSYQANVRKLWEALSTGDKLPLTHDVYLKLFQIYLEKFSPVLDYDLVIVDEAQDLFPVTESIVNQLQGLGARLICLGDRYQQIYAWNRSVNAMEKFERGAACLSLTQSFRCPKEVIDLATPWLRLLGYQGEFRAAPVGKDLPDARACMITRTNSGLLQGLDDLLCAGADLKDIYPLGGAPKYNFQVVYDRLYFMGGRRDLIQSPHIRRLESESDWDEYALTTLDAEMGFAKNMVKEIGVEKTWKLLGHFKSGQMAGSLKGNAVCITTAHKSKGLEFEQTAMGGGFVDIVGDCLKYHEKLDKAKGKACGRAGGLMDAWELERMEHADLWGDQRKPWPLDAEELRLAYVAITRASKSALPGVLSLGEGRLEMAKSLMLEGKTRLFERDAKGDLIPFMPRDAGMNNRRPSLAGIRAGAS